MVRSYFSISYFFRVPTTKTDQTQSMKLNFNFVSKALFLLFMKCIVIIGEQLGSENEFSLKELSFGLKLLDAHNNVILVLFSV